MLKWLWLFTGRSECTHHLPSATLLLFIFVVCICYLLYKYSSKAHYICTILCLIEGRYYIPPPPPLYSKNLLNFLSPSPFHNYFISMPPLSPLLPFYWEKIEDIGDSQFFTRQPKFQTIYTRHLIMRKSCTFYLLTIKVVCVFFCGFQKLVGRLSSIFLLFVRAFSVSCFLLPGWIFFNFFFLFY